MIELNPQTGQQLKILAASPSAVPVVFCFRSDYSSFLRQKIMDEITFWHLYPAGRQILTIFQTDMLEEHPICCLNSAFEMLATHKQLSGKTNTDPADKMSGEFSTGAN